MRAAIYSPYLDTFGGGERYVLTLGEVLSQNSTDVDVLLDPHLYNLGPDYLKNELAKRFNLSLENINFIKAPLGKSSNFLQRIFFLNNYDLLFYLTDGSIFYPNAKKNILHIQSPLVGQPSKSLWGKFKLSGWNKIIYNSNFTKTHSEKNWPKVSQIIYPPVDVGSIKPGIKKNYILSVGRFFGYLKDKKHEVMIRAFKDLYDSGKLKSWSLHLVGSAGVGDALYIEDLKKIAKGLPINFYPNLDYDDLIKLYGESKLYWHAAGYGEDDPTKMEHFGIATVEAMAGGCIPIVIAKGGQLEIVENGKSGFLWSDLEELKEYTLNMVKNKNLKTFSGVAMERAKNFGKEKFALRIKDLIYG